MQGGWVCAVQLRLSLFMHEQTVCWQQKEGSLLLPGPLPEAVGLCSPAVPVNSRSQAEQSQGA